MERPGGRTKEEANIHRTLQVSIAISVGATEAGKVAWSRWLNDGFGYWWVSSSGFSFFHNDGGHGQIIEAMLSLTLALVVLDLALEVGARMFGRRLTQWAHAGTWLLLSLLGAADLALNIGAGGARVSLPLVLFAITECGYVFRMVLPWLHFVLASLVLMILLVVLLLPVLVRLTRAAPECRVPWACKLAVGVYCGGALWRCRSASQGVGADLLSQLSSDALAMLTGTLLPEDSREVLASHGTTFSTATTFFPPILLFHWEAGADILLDRSNASATPYLRRLVQRPDVFSGSAIAGVPVTLKTAWEVLCGLPASSTADFREQGSGLRQECLPRALKRCCGYRSVLAKMDTELPDLPRRVFGFEETIVAEDEHGLLEKLRQLLASWGALNASSPAFVYFYGGDAHPPYYANRVDTSERGFAVEELMDVFLALNRRTDAVAKRLSEFWPPPRKASSHWQKENGLAFTFGDHGEQLSGADPPPHGNLVSPDVSRTMMAFEARSFASRVASPGLFRMADVYATIADLVGLELKGKLFVGTSLFGKLEAQSQSRRFGVASFSFYRPGDLAAAHFRASDGQICAAEFHRGSQGWKLFKADSLQDLFGSGKSLSSVEADPSSTCANESMAALSWALKQRQAMNTLLTESNVHAAWLLASVRAAVSRAAAMARWLLKRMLRPFLPPPATNCSSGKPARDGTRNEF